MPRPACLLSLWLVLLALGLGAGACQRKAKTPDEAWQRFKAAIVSGNAEQLYRSLDLETRWSVMSVRRAHREAYDIVLSNFAEGPSRDQQLRRFEAGALAETDAALLATLVPRERLEALAKELPSAADATPVMEGEEAARVTGASGKPLPFRHGHDGSWGFSGFVAEAEDWKKRATADLEVVRDNAADLERAATRAGN